MLCYTRNSGTCNSMRAYEPNRTGIQQYTVLIEYITHIFRQLSHTFDRYSITFWYLPVQDSMPWKKKENNECFVDVT